ncbi:MAG TPA: thioredoxin domain-containing protein [Kofleriaceae bacterium]|jgi:protein-disulfide isomerase
MKTAFVTTATALIAVLAATSCQSDTKNLEKKIDDLGKKIDALSRNGAGAQQRQQRPGPDPSKVYAVPVDGDPADGPADAKVTLIKAYDYACPFCERVRGTMEELRKKYGNDLRIVYKQFVVHPQVATAGALAFCAAAKQGKAVQMDNLLWDKGFKAHNFDKDEGSTKCWDSPDGCPVVLADAKELNLDETKFKADMKDCQHLMQTDMHELTAVGVGSTPSFFINGRFMVGAMPPENFSALIDEELKKANDRIAQGTPQAQYYQQWVLDKGQKTLEAPKQ